MFVEVTVSVAAPPEAVWDVLIDVERWPTWTASTRSATVVGGGALAVGSVVRIKQPGLPVADWTVTELDPGRSFTWTTESTGMASQGVHEIRATGDGTSEVRLVFEQVGSMAPVVGVVFGRKARRYVQMEADGLKARSEAGPPA